MLVGRKPKKFRTPATRYAKHVIRTTWVFGKKWVEIQKDLDIRTLENRVAKLPDPAVLSLTIFKRPEDDPEPEPDSEAEAEPEPSDQKRSAQLKLQEESAEHKFTHRLKTHRSSGFRGVACLQSYCCVAINGCTGRTLSTFT